MKARAEYQVHQADEMILLNERGEICEGTITNIFADMATACWSRRRLPRACCPACCAPSCSTRAAPRRPSSAHPT